MCLPAIVIDGLSSPDKNLLKAASHGRYFGTATARISIINTAMRMGLVERGGYHPEYGTARWSLTYCGMQAAKLLDDLDNMPLIRDQIMDDYQEARKKCSKSRLSNPSSSARSKKRQKYQTKISAWIEERLSSQKPITYRLLSTLIADYAKRIGISQKVALEDFQDCGVERILINDITSPNFPKAGAADRENALWLWQRRDFLADRKTNPRESHGICSACFEKASGKKLSPEKIEKNNEEIKKHNLKVICAWCQQLIYDPEEGIILRNPLLSKKNKQGFLGKASLKEADDFEENTILLQLRGAFFGYHPNTHILYFLEDSDNKKLFFDAIEGNSEDIIPFFMLRRGFRDIGTIPKFWKNKLAKKLAGAIQFFVTDEKLVITHMAVKPKWQRLGINTLLIKYLEKEFPGRNLLYHGLTDEGRKFMETYGGKEY